MQKTKRDLLYAVADKIGGEQAEKLRTMLKQKSVFDGILDRPMTEEEFSAQLEQMAHGLPKAFARIDGPAWMKSEEWGLN